MGLHSLFVFLSHRLHTIRKRRVVRTVTQPSETCRPADRVTLPVIPPGKCLDNYPDDVVHLVIEAMKDDDGIKPVRMLSLASRRLRMICLPYLFREHCWRTNRRELLPAQFWKYVRFFHLIIDSGGPRSQGSNSIVTALPQMIHITRFKVSGDPVGWAKKLLSGVVSLPSLQSLEFVCPWIFLPGIPSIFVHPPVCLILHLHRTQLQEWQIFMSSGDAAAAMRQVFRGCANTLEYLELCDDSMQLDFIQTLKWPALRDLVICGHSFSQPTSLSDVLVMMPRLKTLDIRYQCRPDSQALLLWPRSTENPPDGYLSELTSLAITNPAIDDAIFKHLPPSLQSFSILAPSYGPMPFDRDELLQLLRGLPAEGLMTLRLVLTGKLNSSLFSFISSTFPRLEVLGICRRGPTDPTETAEEISTNLSELKRLKLVELNIGISPNPYTFVHDNMTSRAWAEKIAHVVPSIDCIAFATHLTYYTRHWVTFNVARSRGVVDDTCSVVSHYAKLPR